VRGESPVSRRAPRFLSQVVFVQAQALEQRIELDNKYVTIGVLTARIADVTGEHAEDIIMNWDETPAACG
jgi:hypothetical protein